mmetsp:Transcript_18448/g.29127  ORF Transcript_18448/g.29127 Transcript_18448/m.29127 type:complete len:185 (-) Transcript_18448:70-624(-)|eukprot:CAMPEP_0169233904 /NCGR_PEP_ID=MMETSP1016-20121227/27875_1 /TAXON_ID=342587 /ORGANISM="Karlodinium micrum, Strain CCMP2283" /LENGTH=184 /DNA_ID=CAMNT_0009313299 /DNA_START=145 /DNA_END=699 /DNA_ORIENTATION=-
MTSTLMFAAVVEMIFGAMFIFFRKYWKKYKDEEGVPVLILGVCMVLFGQTTLQMAASGASSGRAAILFAKVTLAGAALVLALTMATQTKKSMSDFGHTGPLFLYAFLGIPFAVLFMKTKGGGGGPRNARLGDLSDAERNAAAATAPPASAYAQPLASNAYAPQSGGYGGYPPGPPQPQYQQYQY